MTIADQIRDEKLQYCINREDEKQIKTIGDQREKQIKTLEDLNPKEQRKSIEGIFPEGYESVEIKSEINKIKE